MPSPALTTAPLPFGRGGVGQECAGQTPEQTAAFGQTLKSYIRPLTVLHTVDCVEDRPVAQIGDETDPTVIGMRVAYRLPGGLYFAITKSAAAADLAYLRGAKSLQKGYERTARILTELGYPDAGHEDCGASGTAEQSAANEVPEEDLHIILPAMTVVDDPQLYYLRRNLETKRQRLSDGFYGGWDKGWHEDWLAERSPENFARLLKDSTGKPVRHAARGIVKPRAGHGFASTAFYNETGSMAFGFTPESEIVYDIAHRICGSDEETKRFLLEIQAADPSAVLNNLVAARIPVYSQSA